MVDFLLALIHEHGYKAAWVVGGPLYVSSPDHKGEWILETIPAQERAVREWLGY